MVLWPPWCGRSSRLDAAGNMVWARQMGGPGDDAGLAIATDLLGAVSVTGYFEATADFAPVYPGSEELTAKKIRELVGAALPAAIADPLPAELKERERLPQRGDALWALHRPRSLAEAEQGRRRLAFDELLLLQVGLARRRREREAEIAPALPPPGELVAYCGSGVTSCVTLHRAWLAGREGRLYPGSWSEWSKRGLPLERD